MAQVQAPDITETGAPTAASGVVVAMLGAVEAAVERQRPRWLIWAPVFLGLGILAYFSLPREPDWITAVAMPGIGLGLWLTVRRGTPASALALAVMLAGLGFAAGKARTDAVAGPVLGKRLANAEVRGFVELIEAGVGRGSRITLRVTSIAGLGAQATPVRVRIRLKGTATWLGPGAAVRVRARLSPPAAPALPGAFDFGRAAWFQRLGGLGFALSAPVVDDEAGELPAGLRFTAFIEGVRQGIGVRITRVLPGETGAIANALITGERGGISEATNEAFRASGLYHALSISGLHMAVMAGAIFWSLRLGLALIPGLSLRYPIKKWAAAGAALGALFYLLISGASPPTQRSYLMITIMLGAILVDRRALALRNVALSALAILAVFPESLLDLGFQMSYAAVGALVAVHEALAERRRRGELAGGAVARGEGVQPVRRVAGFFSAIAVSTIIASVAVAPFGAFYFHKSQQYSILGNVLGLPVCDLYIMPLVLAALAAMPFGLEALPLWLMGIGIELLVWIAQGVAALPGAVVSVPAMPAPAFMAMVAGGVFLALWNGKARVLGLLPIAAGLAVSPFAERPDVLVSGDGRVVAARLDGVGYSAIGAGGRNFELQRWLEHDGDGRHVARVLAGTGFRCDGSGCTARIKGLLVAVTRSAAGLVEDCRTADIVILTMPRPAGCDQPRVVVDWWSLRDGGVHALYLGSGGIERVTSVADARGERPWSASGLARVPGKMGRAYVRPAEAAAVRRSLAGGSGDGGGGGTGEGAAPSREAAAEADARTEAGSLGGAQGGGAQGVGAQGGAQEGSAGGAGVEGGDDAADRE